MGAVVVALSVLSAVPALASGDTKAGASTIPLATEVREPLESGSDRDWFSFTVKERSQIIVTLSNQPRDADLYLVNPDSLGGATLDRAYSDYGSASPPAIVVGSRVEPGTYYVLVAADDYASGGSRPQYALRIDAEPRLPDRGPDVKYNASPLLLGQVRQDTLDSPTDVDWYRFDITAKSNVAIHLSDQPRESDLHLVNPDSLGGGTLDSAYSGYVSRPPAVSVAQELGPGSYFIRVEADSYYNDITPYSLRVDAVPVAPPPVPRAVVQVSKSGKRTLRIDVDPNNSEADYRIKIKKRTGKGFSTVKSVRTSGEQDVVKVLLKRKGRYMVVVPSQLNLMSGKSRTIRL
jgi:hypothetical protein